MRKVLGTIFLMFVYGLGYTQIYVNPFRINYSTATGMAVGKFAGDFYVGFSSSGPNDSSFVYGVKLTSGGLVDCSTITAKMMSSDIGYFENIQNSTFTLRIDIDAIRISTNPLVVLSTGTEGDVLVYESGSWIRRGKGSVGQVLGVCVSSIAYIAQTGTGSGGMSDHQISPSTGTMAGTFPNDVIIQNIAPGSYINGVRVSSSVYAESIDPSGIYTNGVRVSSAVYAENSGGGADTECRLSTHTLAVIDNAGTVGQVFTMFASSPSWGAASTGGTTEATTTGYIMLPGNGGEVYVASYTFVAIPGSYEKIPTTYTITGVHFYHVTTSTVGFTGYNIAWSSFTTPNTKWEYLFGNGIGADIQVTTNSTTSGYWLVPNRTVVNTNDWIAFHIGNIPASGNLPTSPGCTLRVWWRKE